MSFRVSPLLIVMGLVMFAFDRLSAYLAFLVVVISHEFFHALVAKRLGYKLVSMRLTPSGASLTGEFQGVRLRDEALIAIAGPLFNFATGTLIVAFWWIIPSTYSYTLPFAHASFVTFAINLLPIFPLDGGRVLLAVLSRTYPRQQVYENIRFFGIILASIFFLIALIILFFTASTSIIFMSGFVLISVIIPDKTTRYTRLYSKAYRREKLKKGLGIKQIAVTQETKLIEALKMLNSGYICYFIVMDEQLNTLCVLDEEKVDNALSQYGYEQTFSNLITGASII